MQIMQEIPERVVIEVVPFNVGYRVPSVMLDTLVGLYGSSMFMIWTPSS